MAEKISFVIPCYRSENTLSDVVNEIEGTMATRPEYDYEIVCISDASPDGVFQLIERMAENDPHIRGAEFLRNYGQHAALMAGYRMSKGDVVISVDDDGQIPVDESFELIDELHKGYDIVWGTYAHKQHNAYRCLGSWVNKIMAQQLVGQPKGFHMTSFFAMTRQIVDEIITYHQSYIYIAGLLFRVTQNISCVPVRHRKRVSGDSGYTFSKLVGLWLNGFTAFSVKPLRIASLIGVLSSCASFIYLMNVIIQHYISPETTVGWSSLIGSVFMIGGIILMVLGMIGEYVGRIYICINEAPQYAVRRVIE
ncbi:glycosyltransferase family 2 protein [Selenomonas sp.]|uniref:glycosyltransferase family 2 protein n=1 Tax=Selenomonas sp. TaxID=2053611 RepID=UPI002A7FE127|nr:glycosyltransferase family 2 protein [Selenomonas sp.]MDY4415842.1 glycosyltransferase family 2 protein [Selenomonas sp.]